MQLQAAARGHVARPSVQGRRAAAQLDAVPEDAAAEEALRTTRRLAAAAAAVDADADANADADAGTDIAADADANADAAVVTEPEPEAATATAAAAAAAAAAEDESLGANNIGTLEAAETAEALAVRTPSCLDTILLIEAVPYYRFVPIARNLDHTVRPYFLAVI